MIEVTVVSNLPDFKRQLARFSEKIEKKIVRSATNAAAQAFKKAVVSEAPVLKKPKRGKDPRAPGTLRRAIYAYRKRNPQPGTVQFVVGFRKGKAQQQRKGGSRDAFYGRFLEVGWIPRGPGRSFRGGRRTKALQRERALAGGARKVQYPFIKPGFNKARGAALAAFKTRMTEGVAKASRER